MELPPPVDVLGHFQPQNYVHFTIFPDLKVSTHGAHNYILLQPRQSASTDVDSLGCAACSFVLPAHSLREEKGMSII